MDMPEADATAQADAWIEDFGERLQRESERKANVSPADVHRYCIAVRKELDKKDVASRDWREAQELLGKALGIDWQEVKKGNDNAGKVYPFSSFISQAILSWVPSAFSAFAPANSPGKAAAALAMQTAVTLGSPLVNAVSHLATFPAQELLYRGACKVRPETAGAPTLAEAERMLRAAEAEIDAAQREYENLGDDAPLGDREAIQARLGPALEAAIDAYGKSIAVARINQEGQFWQNLIARCVRTVINGAASMYGLSTGDAKTAFWIQFGGMVATQVSSQFASQWDATNKLNQQLVTMMQVIDVRKADARSLPACDLRPEHMDVAILAKQMEWPYEARIRLAKQLFTIDKKWVDQEIARTEHGLSLVGARQLAMLRDRAGTADEQANDRAKLAALQKKIDRRLTPEQRTRIDSLKEESQQIALDIERLKSSADWKDMAPARRAALQSLMETADETTVAFPYNFMKTPTERTRLARMATLIGARRLSAAEEALPMIDQKFGAYFQMILGGSSTPQLVSASLRFITQVIRQKTNDPRYSLPAGLKFPLGAANIVIGALAAFSSAALINEKTSQRGALRAAEAGGALDLPVGFKSGLQNLDYWKLFGTNMVKSSFALPQGWYREFMAHRAGASAAETLKRSREPAFGAAAADVEIAPRQWAES